MKRGSKYLRSLFIQAAHIILMRPRNWKHFSFGPWLEQTSQRVHKNKLATALANKLARIAWSVRIPIKATSRAPITCSPISAAIRIRRWCPIWAWVRVTHYFAGMGI